MCATSGANQVTLWSFLGDGPAGSTPWSLKGQEENICALAWQDSDGPNSVPGGGNIIASASDDGTVMVYDCSKYVKGDVNVGKPHIAAPIAVFESPEGEDDEDPVMKLLWNKGMLIACYATGKVIALKMPSGID